MALQQVIGRPERSSSAAAVWHRMAIDWDRFWIVPLDNQSLHRAAELAGVFGLNVANSLHLAALDRLPRPATLLTFDDRQVAAAVDLGLDIVDVYAAASTAHGLLRA